MPAFMHGLPLRSALPDGFAVRKADPVTIGVLVGEGIGPEIVPAALSLLETLAQHGALRFEIHHGGVIGQAALQTSGQSLTRKVIDFAEGIFSMGGALFCGPGGARFVYELRAHFDLYCKFTPLQPFPALRQCGPLVASRLIDVDIVTVRENVGGLYQGAWSTDIDADGRALARHSFCYRERDVDRIVGVALRLARRRRNKLSLVLKPGGVPSISRLWSERSELLAAGTGVALDVMEIDNAVYQLIARPAEFDVVVSPNMFGDVIADAGALLLGSRGLSFSGNFSSDGKAAYQTGHGAAHDIAGTDRANPLGQMLSLAMMLEESFALPSAAAAIRLAINDVLASGKRTRDIAEAHGTVLGTQAMTEQVRAALALRLTAADRSDGATA